MVPLLSKNMTTVANNILILIKWSRPPKVHYNVVKSGLILSSLSEITRAAGLVDDWDNSSFYRGYHDIFAGLILIRRRFIFVILEV